LTKITPSSSTSTLIKIPKGAIYELKGGKWLAPGGLLIGLKELITFVAQHKDKTSYKELMSILEGIYKKSTTLLKNYRRIVLLNRRFHLYGEKEEKLIHTPYQQKSSLESLKNSLAYMKKGLAKLYNIADHFICPLCAHDRNRIHDHKEEISALIQDVTFLFTLLESELEKTSTTRPSSPSSPSLQATSPSTPSDENKSPQSTSSSTSTSPSSLNLSESETVSSLFKKQHSRKQANPQRSV
jgi:hypothetical protein